MDRSRFREYEGRINLVYGPFEPPMAHRDSEDDHLWGKRLTQKGATVRYYVRRNQRKKMEEGVQREREDSTQNMPQIKENAASNGSFSASVIMRQIPRIEKGAADSISIVVMLVYMLDISEESASRVKGEDAQHCASSEMVRNEEKVGKVADVQEI